MLAGVECPLGGQGRAGEQPAPRDDAAHAQVGRGAGQQGTGIGHAVGEQPVGGLLQRRVGVGQPLADGRQVAAGAGQLSGGGLDAGQVVGVVDELPTVAALLERIRAEAEATLKRLSS